QYVHSSPIIATRYTVPLATLCRFLMALRTTNHIVAIPNQIIRQIPSCGSRCVKRRWTISEANINKNEVHTSTRKTCLRENDRGTAGKGFTVAGPVRSVQQSGH